MKIKLITGFRNDQFYTIDAEEAHKAYYLFLNPEMRGVFSNGVALVGKTIQGIEPDYNATMGWNPTHKLENDDWNEIRDKKVDVGLKNVLEKARLVAYQIADSGNTEFLALPLNKLSDPRPQELSESLKLLAEKMKV